MNKPYRPLAIGILVSVFLLVGVCKAAEIGRPKPTGTLTVGYASMGMSSCLFHSLTAIQYLCRENVCESMLTLDTKGQLKPMLADRWEMSPDGKTYTFYLHKGVQFQGVGANSPLKMSNIRLSASSMRKPHQTPTLQCSEVSLPRFKLLTRIK